MKTLRGLLFAFPLSVAALVSAAGEVLPNGIVLTSPWPPNHPGVSYDRARLDPSFKFHAPMPVPYLAAPPAVIPIDLGRQLFVDDFLIENTSLTRRWHAVR
jgi:hypothetical protein